MLLYVDIKRLFNKPSLCSKKMSRLRFTKHQEKRSFQRKATIPLYTLRHPIRTHYQAVSPNALVWTHWTSPNGRRSLRAFSFVRKDGADVSRQAYASRVESSTKNHGSGCWRDDGGKRLGTRHPWPACSRECIRQRDCHWSHFRLSGRIRWPEGKTIHRHCCGRRRQNYDSVAFSEGKDVDVPLSSGTDCHPLSDPKSRTSGKSRVTRTHTHPVYKRWGIIYRRFQSLVSHMERLFEWKDPSRVRKAVVYPQTGSQRPWQRQASSSVSIYLWEVPWTPDTQYHQFARWQLQKSEDGCRDSFRTKTPKKSENGVINVAEEKLKKLEWKASLFTIKPFLIYFAVSYETLILSFLRKLESMFLLYILDSCFRRNDS